MLFRRRPRFSLPEGWRPIAARGSALWRLLDDAERELAGEYAEELLATKSWEPAQGFEFDDEARTIIGLHAAIPVLALGPDHYDMVGTIVVRQGSFRRPGGGQLSGTMAVRPEVVDGEAAHDVGTMMVTWSSARREARQPRLGRDVVIHEFAHKLDMRDGIVNGTPIITDEDAHDRWVEVCTRVFEEVRRGEWMSVLRPYAGTDVGEFFAVSTEAFFTRPTEMRAAIPDLYEILSGYFAQDPAARVDRALEAAGQ